MSLQTEMRQDTLMYFNSFICIASYDRVICGFDFDWKKCCVVLILDFTEFSPYFAILLYKKNYASLS